MSENAVSTFLLSPFAAWARALGLWLRSLSRVGESGFAADRASRAEDIERERYAP